MILYNVTYNVDKQVEERWLKYMKEEFVPGYLNTGYFTGNKILRLLNEEYTDVASTFSFQFSIDTIESLEHFKINTEGSIEHLLAERFGGSYVFFKTWLEEI